MPLQHDEHSPYLAPLSITPRPTLDKGHAAGFSGKPRPCGARPGQIRQSPLICVHDIDWEECWRRFLCPEGTSAGQRKRRRPQTSWPTPQTSSWPTPQIASGFLDHQARIDRRWAIDHLRTNFCYCEQMIDVFLFMIISHITLTFMFIFFIIIVHLK